MTFEELVTWLHEDDGYYHAIHCEDPDQRFSVLQMFQYRGFDLDDFSSRILRGEDPYDDLFPEFMHPGLDKGNKKLITCYNSRLTPINTRFVYFKDIIHLIYENEKDDEILSLSDEDFCFAVLSLIDQG